MGLNDRDYGRSSYEGSYGYGEQPGIHLSAPQSVTVRLILFTAGVYILQKLFEGPAGDPNAFDFTSFFAMHACWFRQPWRVYQFLTTGFLHSLIDFRHIIFNMLVLWFFGRSVEERYGRREFLVFYLTAIVFASLCWSITSILQYGIDQPGLLGQSAVGASGALSAVLLLFAFTYPNATVLLFFVIPMKAWMAGLLWVGMDIFGALQNAPGDNIGYGAHLGGFLFAFLYYKSQIRLTDYLPTNMKFKLPSFKRKPSLRVHRPTGDDEDAAERRLDELLEKVARGGQDSLTGKERRELQKLSKHYQNKRR